MILGSGRDRTYLRYRFGGKEGRAGDDDDVRWFGVDHPSMTKEKARVWLPRCVPDGYNYNCIGTKRNGDECGTKMARAMATLCMRSSSLRGLGGLTATTPKAARTTMDR